MRKKEKVDVKDLLIIGLLVFGLIIAGMQGYALIEIQSKIEELEELAKNPILIDTDLTSSNTVGSSLPGMVGGC